MTPSLTPQKVKSRLRYWLRKFCQTPKYRKSLQGVSLKKGEIWEVAVSLVGPKVMTDLNHAYLGKEGPTDVLSFPVSIEFQRFGYLGEIIICKSVLTKQAKQHGHSLMVELDVLIVHGLIHLLGYDHEGGPAQEKQMLKIEQSFLGKKAGLISRTQSAHS